MAIFHPDGEPYDLLLNSMRPQSDVAVASTTVGQPLFAHVVTAVGREQACWAVEASSEIYRDMLRERGAEDGQRPPGRSLVESVALWSVLTLAGPKTLVPPDLDDAVRECVRLDTSVDLALRCVRFTHAELTSRLFGLCAAIVPVAGQTAAMREVSDRLFKAMDQMATTLTDKLAAKHDRRLTGPHVQRAELVRAILDGACVSTGEAIALLDYDLTLYHVALVLWCEHNRGDCGCELERTAERLLDWAGCALTLLLPAGRGRLWAWGGRPDLPPRDFSQLEAQFGLHVASGLSGDGLAGFRLSHEQASSVERVVRQAASPTGLHDYPSMELPLLLCGDLSAAAAFVARELGPLATDDMVTGDLRVTVKCYLDNDRSPSAVAESLHVTKNTVIYRVRKAEHLLGRSLRGRHLCLHVALQLAETLGTAVLRAAAPPAGGPQ